MTKWMNRQGCGQAAPQLPCKDRQGERQIRTGFAGDAEAALDAGDAEAVHDVLRQPERHDLGARQLEARVEEVAKVDLDVGAALVVDQQVLAVPVPEADDVARDRPRRRRVHELRARLQPRPRVRHPA